MSNKREQPKVEGGNGPALIAVPPPLSTEEFAEIVASFKNRGLPVILYVFNGPESISANRLLANVHFRQMGAISHELGEWAAVGERQHIQKGTQQGGVARTGIVLPSNLRGQGQG